jgi:AAA+ superfamily predicted ATPase
MEKRIIELPQGGTLELDCTSEFFDVVKKSLNITGRDVSDAELKGFIYEAFKSGIDKAEKELIEKEQLIKDD